jgi:CheY-like chemotaxis protein
VGDSPRETSGEELLSAVGHTLNGPVAVIGGYAHLLAARDDDQLRVEAAAQIAAAATALTAAHEDILTLVALETGAVGRRRAPLPVGVVLERALRSGNAVVEAAPRVSIEGDLTVEVLADGWLSRVLGNLIAAACSDGAGAVGVARDGACLSVSSHGGMVQLRLRARPRMQADDRGILALHAATLAFAHYGGSLHVGQATAEAIELQIALPPAARSEVPLRIAIIDDDDAVRRILGLTIASDAAEIVEASDGVEALALLDGLPRPDLLILDWRLPGPRGSEVLAHAKQIDAHLPVVVLTANGEGEHRELAASLGADAFLTKPFSPIELLETVRRLLPAAF